MGLLSTLLLPENGLLPDLKYASTLIFNFSISKTSWSKFLLLTRHLFYGILIEWLERTKILHQGCLCKFTDHPPLATWTELALGEVQSVFSYVYVTSPSGSHCEIILDRYSKQRRELPSKNEIMFQERYMSYLMTNHLGGQGQWKEHMIWNPKHWF